MNEFREFLILTKIQSYCSQVWDLSELSEQEKSSLIEQFGDDLIYVCEVPKLSKKSKRREVEDLARRLLSEQKGVSIPVAAAMMSGRRGLKAHFERFARRKLSTNQKDLTIEVNRDGDNNK